MPKVAKHALIWLPEQNSYALREQERLHPRPLRSEDEQWFSWLAACSSFAFQGKHGHLTLRRETRARGEGYWYAYRGRGRRTFKRYAGRTSTLTIARLEAIASALTSELRQAPEPILTPASQRPVLLLETKLHLPRLHASLISRERLLAHLDAVLTHKLTLLTAPAGFGKTTLVRQWLADRGVSDTHCPSFPPLAWVSLDPSDNDPARFWSYVITACQAFQTGIGQSTLSFLYTTMQPPFEPSPLEKVLTTFLNELVACTNSGILVLEDYHVITSPLIHETVTFLLDHLPANLHLIIMTRSDSSLPLARLRASGDLHELRAPDLRFTREEMRTFLQHISPFLLTEEAIRQLDDRLDGWAAGLRLLALKLQGCTSQQEVEHTFATFAGSNRSLQDYFVTEVLTAQPEPLQDFLLQTSMLRRMSGSLCNFVTERSDSQYLMEALDRGGLFLESLDESGEWYRYHALFAESMRAAARHRLGEEELRALSYRASQWYEQHGFFGEAVEAALRAQDVSRATSLIEYLTGSGHFHEINEFHTLCRWLEQIPETVIRFHPALCFSYATALLFISIAESPAPATLARIEKALQMAEQSWQSSGNKSRVGEIFAFRSLIAHQLGETQVSVTYARRALTWLPAGETAWRSISLIVVGEEEHQSGQLDLARKLLHEARTRCEATGNRYFTRATINMLGEVCFEQGELHQAAAYYPLVLTEARERVDLDDICHALLGLAQLSYEWNDLQEAGRAAQEVLDLCQQLAHESHYAHAAIILARVQHARGQTASAQQQLAMLLARIQEARSPLLYREVLAWQTRLQLAAGNLTAVQRWVTGRSRNEAMLPMLYHEREELIVARWLLAQGKAAETLNLLEPMLSEAHEAGRIRSSLEIQMLMALAHVVLKQVQEARQKLRVVLSCAQGEGYLRLLLDEGESLATLLHTCSSYVREKPLTTYLQTVLQAFAQGQPGQDILSSSVSPGPGQLIDPLSPQEQRVLRLLVAGCSNQEIAGELIVSVNTIRTQVQSIYRKLNVHNRFAASEVARQQRLL
jgi:LuxR family maltose regulon positive regulatory protein